MSTTTAAPIFLFATIPLLWKVGQQCRSLYSRKYSPSLLKDPSEVECQVLAPGLVIMKSALSMESQMILAEQIFQYGHCQRKWWERTKVNKENLLLLNNYRQDRGRIYDALSHYPGFEILRRVCVDSVSLARQLDPYMPALTDPTHLLTLYYSSARKLGWHRDDGAHDGQSNCPVVSISLGNSCDFLYRAESKDEPKLVRLDSGDVLLFGGPSRHVLHSVSTVHQETCPPSLLDLHRYMLAPSPEERQADAVSTPPPSSFRLNLTFRHAPELFGKENDERFFFFAKSARKFLDLAAQLGVVRAREVANAARKDKKRKGDKKDKKDKKRWKKDGVDAAGPSVEMKQSSVQ